MDIYGIEKNFMESTDPECVYIGEIMKNPYGIGKNYKDREVVELLYDIQEYSTFVDPLDKIGLYTN